jgi:hypothetical protein
MTGYKAACQLLLIFAHEFEGVSYKFSYKSEGNALMPRFRGFVDLQASKRAVVAILKLEQITENGQLAKAFQPLSSPVHLDRRTARTALK